MSLSFDRVVKVTSSVGGASIVARRELIGRVFSPSPLVPIDSVLEFANAAAVAAYFGSESQEAARARFYFAYVDPSGNTPNKISFARFAATIGTPTVYGAPGVAQLSQLASISAGTLTLILDGVETVISGVDLSGSASFAVIGAALQTAIRDSGVATLANATVTYDALRQNFVITTGTAGPGRLEIGGDTGMPNDLSGPLAVAPVISGSIVSPGTNPTSPSAALNASVSRSDNFGTFCFMSPFASLADRVAVAQANAAFNVRFMMLHRVTTAEVPTLGPAMIGIASQGAVHVDPTNGEFPEMLPMAVAAAINYDRPNSSVNFMFRQNSGAALSATVFDDTQADEFDRLRINYVGETQNSGRKIAFFMLGNLGGGLEAITAMGVHVNEQWLKSEMIAGLGNLLLSQGRVPANASGRSLIMSVALGIINQAQTNGVISIGKDLTDNQRAFVIQVSADPRAPIQVSSDGYWLDVAIRSEVDSSNVEYYYAAYVLVYAKDDAIRRIEGVHNLI